MAILYGKPGKEWGDQLVYQQLSKLPDRFHIYAQPVIQMGSIQRFPDYILVDCRRGLIVLEVKDWRVILKANRTQAGIVNSRNSQIVWQTSPIEQARLISYLVKNALASDPALIHHRGRHQGNLKFPVEYAGVLPHQDGNVISQLEGIWGRKRVFGQNDVVTQGIFSDKLNQFPFRFSIENELTTKELNVIHSYLHPSITIKQELKWEEEIYPSRADFLPIGVA